MIENNPTAALLNKRAEFRSKDLYTFASGAYVPKPIADQRAIFLELDACVGALAHPALRPLIWQGLAALDSGSQSQANAALIAIQAEILKFATVDASGNTTFAYPLAAPTTVGTASISYETGVHAVSPSNGSSPLVRIAGYVSQAVNLVVQITTGGNLGASVFQASFNGGATWPVTAATVPSTGASYEASPSSVQPLANTGQFSFSNGLAVKFPAGTYTAGDTFTWSIGGYVGGYSVFGSGLALTIATAEAANATPPLPNTQYRLPDSDMPSASAVTATLIAAAQAQATRLAAKAVAIATALLGS